MIHLRIVSPAAKAAPALDELGRPASVCNVVHPPGAAREPHGDVILADVAREDASVVVSDLRELGLQHEGSISLDPIDTQLSDRAERAIEHARGAPADAVVCEEVEARTSEQVVLSGVYLAFLVLAGLLAMVGIYQDSAILIVGAMVVGPESGAPRRPVRGARPPPRRSGAAVRRGADRALPARRRRRLRHHAAAEGGRLVRSAC